MKSCPKCQSLSENTDGKCHSCGTVLVADVAPAKAELEEGYRLFLEEGKQKFVRGSFEEATNCLREAVKRSRTLEDALGKEIEARKHLAEALEKLGKCQEAADQFRIISQETPDKVLKELWLKKSQDLVASSSAALPYDLLFQKEEFRTLSVEDDERRVVPLYCAGCKRLLAEAEVYGFRRALNPVVRCWCGSEGVPLAKQDSKQQAHIAPDAKITISSGQRARAVSAASKEIEGGKKKNTAAMFALFLGFAGGHKFYLGEATAGFIYLMWFWTLIPFLISIYEAIILFEMSLITFNMTYNIELVLTLVEPEEIEKPLTPKKADVFSMEITQTHIKRLDLTERKILGRDEESSSENANCK